MTSEARETIENARACMPYRWRLAFSNRFRVFVWTGKCDSKSLRVDVDFFIYGGKNLSFRQYPDTGDGDKAFGTFFQE